MKLSAAVSLIAIALASAPAFAEDVPLKQPGHWAQDYLHRPADPQVLFGTLPNGLRYAIMHNETPADGVAMRLRIGSGSLEERDEEQGLAHYLEHMAFRGSAHIADGEVVHMLERQGLRFGPDTNAFTIQNQTVYQFNFPKADASALDTGLTLFREIGERLSLAPAAVDAERGVVLSEERLRDVPPYRALKANIGNALAGTIVPRRWPIGQAETIKAATPERLRRFYAANYRPDNATIVVVGKIDPKQVEAEIRARFADWQPAGNGDPLPVVAPVPAQPITEFVEAGVQDLMSLSWVRPLDQRAETEAVDREVLAEQVAMTILNNRLADRAAKPGSSFLGGQAGMVSALFGVAGLTQLQIAAAPDKWREALGAVVEEQRQLLTQGVGNDDLKRAVTQVRTSLQAGLANAPTRKSPELADALVSAASDDQLYTSPAQDLAFADPVLAALTPGDVTMALAKAFAGKGPVLFRSAQAKPVGTDVLKQQLVEAYSRALSGRADAQALVWPYTSFGPTGRVVARTEDRELGTTTVTFANGSRLIVKPTAFEKDRILVNVALGTGRKGASAELVHALWATSFMPLGGTSKLSAGELRAYTQSNGKVASATLKADTGAFVLSGATRPADFAFQMQALAAYARDPGFRPELGEKLKAVVPMIAGQLEANAGAVFLREAQRLAGGGDNRFVEVPASADLVATAPQEVPALLRAALAGPADVTVVGDIKPDDAIAAMLATFASGADHAPLTNTPAHITMPQGRDAPYVVAHGGRPDQAFLGTFWALPDYFADPRLSYTADVAAAVLQSRLIDTVREKLGLTYSPQVQAVSSWQIEGMGYFGAILETPQANFETFRSLLGEQLKVLATKPLNPDELDRAKHPLIEARTKETETNAYWAGNLALELRDPRLKAAILDHTSGITAVTARDVQTLFQQYVDGKVPVTVIAKGRQ